MRAVSSWSVAGALTLVLSTTAVALMSHAPTDHAPLSEPIAAHSSPTTVPSSEAPPTTSPPVAPTTLAPVPTTVTYTYSYSEGGDDGSSSAYGSGGSGAYGDD